MQGYFRIAAKRALLSLLTLALAALGGCGGAEPPHGAGGGDISQTPSTHGIDDAGANDTGSAGVPAGGSAYPAFPDEGDGPYSAVRAVSDSEIAVDGKEWVEQHGANNRPGAGNAYVIAPGGDDDLAWAKYSIEGLTVERPVDIAIGVTGVIAPGGDDDLPLSYWLGLSDYTNYRWEWRGDPEDAQGGPYTAPAELVLNSEEVRERYVSAAGVFHFVILTESSSVEPDTSNPEGITSVEIVSSTIAAKDATAPDYKPTAPHYVPIQSISVGGGGGSGSAALRGGGSGKGASALDPDTQYVTITWEHVQDFEHPNGEAFIYQVARQGPEDAGKVQLGSVLAPETVYVDPLDNASQVANVIPGATYRYFVRGANPQWGWTPFATNDTVTIPLLPPTEFSASDGLSDEAIILTWVKAEGATGYEVFRDSAPLTTVGDVDTWDDTEVGHTAPHNYWLKSINAYGMSGFSDLDSGFRSAAPSEQPPPAPLNLEATDGAFEDKVLITWNTSATAEGYKLFRADTELGAYSQVADTINTQYSDLAPDYEVYWYEVLAYNGNGESGFSNADSGFRERPIYSPVADLTADPSFGDAPLAVSLDASGSSDSDGTIVQYEWDFDGDGIYDEDTGAVPTTGHTYIEPGIYDATVRVTDDDFATDTASVLIDVNDPPTASLSADPTSGGAPLVVDFDASESTDSDGNIVQYAWDWDGDGSYDFNSGSVPTVQHEYLDPGTYDATVRVTDDDGAVDTASVQISVKNRGDWWMLGREPTHNRRSPFTGPATNALKWSYTTGDLVHSSPAIGADGTIYVGSYDNKLYAIHLDGTLNWSYTASDDVFSSPAIGTDGTIYVGSGQSSGGGQNNLHAINVDGTPQWSYPTGNSVTSSPAIASDGTIYVGSLDSKLYAINPDGTLKWSYTTGERVYSSPAIGADGTIYVGSLDNKLYAINPDGTLKWSYTTGNTIYSSPAIGSDGTIYVGSWSPDNKLYAINHDGSFKWSYTTGSLVQSSPAIGADGTIYVGSFDNKLYAINHDGSFKWSYTTGSLVQSSPAIGADGTIYVGSFDDKLYAINPDGTLMWSYTTGGEVFSSPAIGADGTIYVGSGDSKLYAIGPGEGT